MIDITITCHKCKGEYKYHDSRGNLSDICIGSNISCPSCGNSFVINRISRLAEIRAILIIFDECLHISGRKRSEVAGQFMKHFRSILSNKIDTAIPVAIPSTKSPMLDLKYFFHDDKEIPYEGQNKDLAIIQYCSSGIIIDKTGTKNHILDEVKQLSNDPRVLSIPHKYWTVIFATKDKSKGDPGMKKARTWLSQSNYRTEGDANFVCIDVPEEYSNKKHKAKYIAEILAVDISKRFVKAEKNCWFIDIS